MGGFLKVDKPFSPTLARTSTQYMAHRQTPTDTHARTKRRKKTIHRITQEPLCESIRFLSVAILVLVILVAKVGEISEAASPLITANTHTHTQTGMSHQK